MQKNPQNIISIRKYMSVKKRNTHAECKKITIKLVTLQYLILVTSLDRGWNGGFNERDPLLVDHLRHL